MIRAGRPISALAVAKPQHTGYLPARNGAPACRSDTNRSRRGGAKSFAYYLALSRGVVLSRADLFCDLLRLSPLTRRFVRFRRTYLLRCAELLFSVCFSACSTLLDRPRPRYREKESSSNPPLPSSPLPAAECYARSAESPALARYELRRC